MALFTAALAYLESLGPGSGYFILLLASGFVFICMAVLSLAGGETHGGSESVLDGDLDSGSLEHSYTEAEQGDVSSSDTVDAEQGMDLVKYLSFRNCINYLLGFSFCGFLASQGGLHPMLSALLALSGGFISAIIMYKLMAALYSLSDVQPLRKQEAFGALAKVYIQIGSNRSGRGKIMLKVKGAQREFSALTDHEAALRTGAVVRVTGMADGCYLVEPAAREAAESAMEKEIDADN